MRVQAISPDRLYHNCDPAQFAFETTQELELTDSIIGQERAVEAVRFGIGIQQEGYNLFALGANGTGKHTAVRRYLVQKAVDEPTPPDWCYVNNFEQEDKPKALQLPPGQGMAFCKDMEKLLEELFAIIPQAFESEEYQAQRQSISEALQQKQEASLEELSQKAEEHDIALVQSQAGLGFAPLRDGEAVSPDEFMTWPEEEREEVQQEIAELQADLQKALRQVPLWNREIREELKALDREVTQHTIDPLIDELRQKYAGFSAVLAYLGALEEDIVDHLDKFRATAESGSNAAQQQSNPNGALIGMARRRFDRNAPFFNRYKVNLLVDNGRTEGAPVIYENHPTYPNLIGRIEHMAQMGALFTDFTMIKPGALHRACGGYLILDVRKVLLQPYTWESLKRALQAGELTVESPGQAYSLISTVSLEPEPIPLDVKVILLGDRRLYYLLYRLDPDFRELFKVAADFEDEMARDREHNQAYARLIGSLAEKDGLHHFDKTAVARVIEHSSRLAGDAERLSAHMQTVADLLREASYWAGEAQREIVTADDIQQAIDAQEYRDGRIRERMQENVLRDTILIDTEGEVVGQINGLSVLNLGRILFGRPNRITARVRLGKGEVIDIERKVEMGGPIHSKGVLILSGFLGGRYAADRPLSLSASLVFEQSYSGVEGDSASSAELYALLSSLADVPLKQSLAVTGSVNQHGRVQAIGGVNQKIEGFFDICEARGLTGEQGVLIPAANVKNLMLRLDVVAAVERGDFHIYPVETIDEGIEALTGLPAGKPDAQGRYPEESVNGRVMARLQALAEKRRTYSQPEWAHDGSREAEREAAQTAAQ